MPLLLLCAISLLPPLLLAGVDNIGDVILRVGIGDSGTMTTTVLMSPIDLAIAFRKTTALLSLLMHASAVIATLSHRRHAMLMPCTPNSKAHHAKNMIAAVRAVSAHTVQVVSSTADSNATSLVAMTTQ